jgi:methylenetetrahydrofolate dehydrogenase (NADP+)/methenyltetrahydrofolate cyclohydrolase
MNIGSAKIIDGKSIAARLTDEVKREIAASGIRPGLGVILVGDDPASHLYVSLKEKACAAVGITFEKYQLPSTASAAQVLLALERLNDNDAVDAILIQLPLPTPLAADKIIAKMKPEKDVDGFHPLTIENHLKGASAHPPGLIEGIMTLIRSTDEALAGKNALVVANSEVFYTPLEKSLRDAGLTPSFVKANDPALEFATRQTDVLVVAAGRPRFIHGGMLKPGVIVIDVGTSKIDGKVVGDVDQESARRVAGHITPVPGGVGPVTIAMLLQNALALAKKRRG